MNNKFKELAKRSWFEGGDEVQSGEKLAMEKFAELIIRECCEEIDSVNTGDYGRDEYDKGYDAGLRQAIETIKEHFGVK